MDDRKFDTLTRTLGETMDRRKVIRGLMALAAGVVSLNVAGTSAARRGYGGPRATIAGNGSAYVVGRPSSQPGLCRIGCAVSGIPGPYPLDITVYGDQGERTVVEERFRVTASSSGDALVVTNGAVDGSAECYCTIWWDGHLISSSFLDTSISC